MRRVGRNPSSVSRLQDFPKGSLLVALVVQEGKRMRSTRGTSVLASGLILLVLSTLVSTLFFSKE